MYGPIEIPGGVKMLYNVLTLKEGVVLEDIEMTIGELCEVVSRAYGNEMGGFVCGQVFKFSGFVSEQGSLNSETATENHIAIVTYWRSFDHHEKSHAGEEFKKQFELLSRYCESTHEIGYKLLWQGAAEQLSV